MALKAMTFDLLSIMFFATALGFVALFVLLPRYGPHYTSRLTCPNCRKNFNFHWIPGATLTSLINRNRRTLKCPYCHVKSIFDIGATRVFSGRNSVKSKPKA